MKFLLFVLLICAHSLYSQATGTVDDILNRVAAIHGNAGVFAVAGYRMGERALRDLGEQRGSFTLDVTHRTPLQVQYSCGADGFEASTGVSAGKLNLHIVEVPLKDLESVAQDKKTGKKLVFRLNPKFISKYLDTSYENQAQAAR